MNTLEIEHYLKNYRQFFGVYARDMLPFAVPPYSGIIINTDESDEPGEHWVAIYLGNRAIYFDSFGNPPIHTEIIEFLDRISPNGWHYNQIIFQSIYSATCGSYCLYFLLTYFNGGDIYNFMSIFNLRPNINDRIADFLYKMGINNIV